jgi:hypothetical protein
MMHSLKSILMNYQNIVILTTDIFKYNLLIKNYIYINILLNYNLLSLSSTTY